MDTKAEITLKDRVNEMYKYAISGGFATSKTDFAEKCGMTNVTLSRFLNGKQEPSLNILQEMNAKMGMPFNSDWLFNGVGSMIGSNEPKANDSISILVTEMRESRIAKDEQIDRLLRIIENMQKQ